MVRELSGLLGKGEVLYISCDDKSHVYLGVVAAKLQKSMVMKLKDRVRLPDHDFMIGKHESITPSVYGICDIISNTTTAKAVFDFNPYIYMYIYIYNMIIFYL